LAREKSSANWFWAGEDSREGIASSRQHDFDFSADGYFDDFKIAVAYCEKQNTDSVKYFSKLNIQIIEICFTDFNCDKQNNILRNTAFD
jgi:hypothetical protein